MKAPISLDISRKTTDFPEGMPYLLGELPMPKFEMTVKVYIEADDLGTAHYAVLAHWKSVNSRIALKPVLGRYYPENR